MGVFVRQIDTWLPDPGGQNPRRFLISKKCHFIFVVMLALSPVLCANTSIVIYRNATTIFAAADSATNPPTKPVCKFFQLKKRTLLDAFRAHR